LAAETVPKITLVTGGARSGKSRFAEELACKSAPPVLFVATAEAGDEEMGRRIAAHRQDRPRTWRTVETPTGLAGDISRQLNGARTVLIDCVTMLVSNIFQKNWRDTEEIDEVLETAVMKEIGELVNCLELLPARFIIITNEVGLGIVPADRMTRQYRDLLGKANQSLAQHADEVYLLTAGIPLRIKTARI